MSQWRRALRLVVLELALAGSGGPAAQAQYVYYQSPWAGPLVVPSVAANVATIVTPMVVPLAAPVPIPLPVPVVAASPAPVRPPQGSPVARLQTALVQLGLYQGPVTGVRDRATSDSLRCFLRLVPLPVKRRYGNQVAALAEAATRGEFPLLTR